MAEPTFLVDKKGLAKILARRGKEFIVTELIQNAWDEAGVTEVRVDFTQNAGHAVLSVLDDAPDGFADLSHAYTLFAESKKKANPTQRGRFNIGEKMVIAICDRVQIETTKGTIVFDEAGRTHSKAKTKRGSVLRCELRMNASEAEALHQIVSFLIPPEGLVTTFNGHALVRPKMVGHFIETLPTERADAEGFLRPTARQTEVAVYAPINGDKAMLFEMGIPVVETGDTYHVDVAQKVPLNSDRDNVTPSYLQKVRTAVLNHMSRDLSAEEASRPWVAAALEDKNADVEAVKAIVTTRFGDKVVISDPSDPEGTKIAVAQGYTVLAPRTFSKEAWANVKAAGVLPAGQVTPSPKPYGEGRPENVVPRDKWNPSMEVTVDHCEAVMSWLVDRPVSVKIANEPMVPWAANFGRGAMLTLNLGRLGRDWFNVAPLDQYQLALLLHEAAHEWVSDHLSSAFADRIADLGAKLAFGLLDRQNYALQERFATFASAGR